MPIPMSFPVQMASSTRAPVGGVDAGQLSRASAGALGQVGDPQSVAPPLFVFELGQLGAGWWAVPGGRKLGVTLHAFAVSGSTVPSGAH